MSRLALIALAVALIGGCKPAADAEPIDSPGDSIAGTETKRGGRSSTSGTATLAGQPRLSSTLVAVATTPASEAQPCERVCGSLGDCLLADDDYTTAVAGGLELECLNLCVHAPDSEPVKAEFLACGAKTECGQLTACAEQTWVALANARRGPEIAGVIASADPCRTGCRWIWACMYTQQPPGEAYLDPFAEQQTNACIAQCDEMGAAERDTWAQVGRCVMDYCSSVEHLYECFDQSRY